MIERLIKDALWRFGFQLRRRRTSISWELMGELLQAKQLTPQTIFDIGVATGTPELYRMFPHARYLLFDPDRESRPHMDAIARSMDAQIFNVGLGEHNGEMVLLARSKIGSSSFFEPAYETKGMARYPVPVRRLDELIKPDFDRPALTKIDVQGAELMVLRGAGDLIASFDVVVIEIGFLPTVLGRPEYREVFQFMHEHGFVVWDLVQIIRRPLDLALSHIDFVFVPANSPLRSDKRWAA